MTLFHSMRLRLLELSIVVAFLPLISKAADPEVRLLWLDGAPGSEGRTGRGETRLYNDLERIVTDVHEPTLTSYLPAKTMRTGAGIVIFPGGGHRELWSDHEGHNVGHWLADRGIAAFVVHYRLSRSENSPYTLLEHSLADAHQAIRLVRENASSWKVDAGRIGIMGFSAGGELAALAAAIYEKDTRPSFQALIYPGSTVGVKVEEGAPDAFLASGHGDNDQVAKAMADFYQMFRDAGVSAEMHVFSDAGHGFGLRESNSGPSSRWLDRLYEWMDTRGYLDES